MPQQQMDKPHLTHKPQSQNCDCHWMVNQCHRSSPSTTKLDFFLLLCWACGTCENTNLMAYCSQMIISTTVYRIEGCCMNPKKQKKKQKQKSTTTAAMATTCSCKRMEEKIEEKRTSRSRINSCSCCCIYKPGTRQNLYSLTRQSNKNEKEKNRNAKA